jgi:hypothetical protein
MAESKGKKSKKRSDERPVEPKELVLTISKGEVIKVETLDDSGRRNEVSEREFAELSGEDEMEDLEAALEEAYAAGIGDLLEETVEAEFADDEDERIRNAIVREAAARQLLRSGVRRLILRRALQRGTARKPKYKRPRTHHNGVEEEASEA